VRPLHLAEEFNKLETTIEKIKKDMAGIGAGEGEHPGLADMAMGAWPIDLTHGGERD
jgi:hypothetical protein